MRPCHTPGSAGRRAAPLTPLTRPEGSYDGRRIGHHAPPFRTAKVGTRFEAAQHDEKFLAWVEMNEAVLELEFDDVPDLPARPWDAEALDIAEAAALERFSSAADAFTNDKVPVAWQFVRLLGQTFIDAFDGFWVNLPGSEEVSPRVGVNLPYRTMHIEPIGLLTSAMNRRTGIEWSKVFTYVAEDYAEYLKTR